MRRQLWTRSQTRARPPSTRQGGNALASCKRSTPRSPGVRGLRDLWQGWRDYRELWLTVGLFDVRKRYRRSVLGPFWITISLGAFILGLGFIYSPLVGGGTASFLPFVAFGFIAWQFIS